MDVLPRYPGTEDAPRSPFIAVFLMIMTPAMHHNVFPVLIHDAVFEGDDATGFTLIQYFDLVAMALVYSAL